MKPSSSPSDPPGPFDGVPAAGGGGVPAVDVYHVVDGPPPHRARGSTGGTGGTGGTGRTSGTGRDGGTGGSPILMINSLGSTLEMWHPQARALAATLPVIRYDLRGHGRSPAPPGPYTIQELAADAIALLDRLGVVRAHVCGLSLGGMIGMWLAAHAPERVDRLVLCCTSARLAPARQWADRARTVRERGTGAVADAVVGRWVTPGYAARHPDRVRDLRAMVAATPAAGYAGCCAVIQRLDLRPVLASITAPTLVVAGAADPATPPEHSAEIAARVPGARLTIVPDAAHLANLEQPATVTGLIHDHLRREEP